LKEKLIGSDDQFWRLLTDRRSEPNTVHYLFENDVRIEATHVPRSLRCQGGGTGEGWLKGPRSLECFPRKRFLVDLEVERIHLIATNLIF